MRRLAAGAHPVVQVQQQSPQQLIGRERVLLLAAVVLLPGFLAAVFAVQKVRDGAREAALGTLRETVREFRIPPQPFPIDKPVDLVRELEVALRPRIWALLPFEIM